MIAWGRRHRMLVGLVLALWPSLGRADGAAVVRRAAVDEGAVATLEGANAIYLEVQAASNDSYVSMAVRFAGSERQWAAIERTNDSRPVRTGLFYAVPFEILTPAYKARCLTALFPGDGPDEEGWVHRVPEGDEGQRLESVATWYTGDASLADDLAESNGVEWKPLPAGAEIAIPSDLLVPELRKAAELPPAAPPRLPSAGPPPLPARQKRPPVTAGELTFFDDEAGGYAVYKMKAGEALYSSVVARFTGRLDPDEVNAIATRIAAMSGIRRPTSIPVGQRVKIPRDLILPEFLPREDPEHLAYEARLAGASRHRLTVSAQDLKGVVIILDAGHGGDDIGAQRNGVHEDDYVYDIMCRIKEVAERTTGARVLTTIRDESSGFKPQEGPFPIDRDEVLLTSPVYHPRKPYVTTVGVNLRWYLVNSFYRSLTASGVDPQKIVFASIHADSLHPSVRGAMVYVPGQAYRGRVYGHVGRLYDRKEVDELRYVKFSQDDRELSEGLSRRLAGRIVEALGDAGLPVHRDQPVRDHIIRMRRTYAPAVIRSSLVPQSILLEVANLNNPSDAHLMKEARFRQEVAQAFVAALRRQYAGAPGRQEVAGRSAARN
jgi:N-acetylmuramoyl-L-alanine amidase